MIVQFIYETKGLSLEEVDELYETISHAWNSMNFTPSISYARKIHFNDGKVDVEHKDHNDIPMGAIDSSRLA